MSPEPSPSWGTAFAYTLMALTTMCLILLSLLAARYLVLKPHAQISLRILVSALLLPTFDVFIGFGLMLTLRFAGIVTNHGFVALDPVDLAKTDKNVFIATAFILPFALLLTLPVTFDLFLISVALRLVSLVFDLKKLSAQRASLITYGLALPAGVLTEIWAAENMHVFGK